MNSISITQKFTGRSHEIWGIGRLWTREDLDGLGFDQRTVAVICTLPIVR